MPAFRYSGRVAPEDDLHRIALVDPILDHIVGKPAALPIIAPTQLKVTITNPGPAREILINQYGPNKTGTAVYNPAKDCDGAFMSFKNQPNNNCYAYACDFASNTFAQPGRKHGNLITASTLNGRSVDGFAALDGLIHVGTSIDDVKAFAAKRKAANAPPGHFVALLISAADGQWPGDYHWARCDDPISFASWSQKDGGDQVTNFDFAGNLITDPSEANWQVNQGRLDRTSNDDMVVTYEFYSFMFVPHGMVDII